MHWFRYNSFSSKHVCFLSPKKRDRKLWAINLKDVFSKIWKLSSSGDSHFKHMLCITERKYMTLIVSKIFPAKHLVFFLLSALPKWRTPNPHSLEKCHTRFNSRRMFSQVQHWPYVSEAVSFQAKNIFPSASHAASAVRAFPEPERTSSQIPPLLHQGHLKEHQVPPSTVPHP